MKIKQKPLASAVTLALVSLSWQAHAQQTPQTTETVTVTGIRASLEKNVIAYDKTGDYHYDTISAFIKSMRGSDPDATLYWLAKMIHAGEDPRFITRRIVIRVCGPRSTDSATGNPTNQRPLR